MVAHVLFWAGIGFGFLTIVAHLFMRGTEVDGAKVAYAAYRVGFLLAAAAVAKYIGY